MFILHSAVVRNGKDGGQLEGERDRSQPWAQAAEVEYARCFQTEATGHGDQLKRWEQMGGTWQDLA